MKPVQHRSSDLTDAQRLRDTLIHCFVSPNVADSNLEPANLVDTTQSIANAINSIASAIDNLADAIRVNIKSERREL